MYFTQLDLNNLLTSFLFSSEMLIQLSDPVILLNNANKRELQLCLPQITVKDQYHILLECYNI